MSISVPSAVGPWTVQIDPVDGPPAVNLVPNPSFDLDTIGSAPAVWSTTTPGALLNSGATATIISALDGTWTAVSEQVCEVVTTAGSSHQGIACPLAPVGSANFIPGQPYTLNLWLAGSGTVDVLLGANGDLATLNVPLTTEGQAYMLEWIPTSSETVAYVVVRTSSAAIATFHVDTIMAVEGRHQTYFDGEGVALQGTAIGLHAAPASLYSWSGTPGQSYSTRTNERATFDLNTIGSAQVDTAGIDWGDAVIQALEAQSKVGSLAVDYVMPNRTVTIPLGLGMDELGQEEVVRNALQQKVGLLQREGGVLLRQREMGPPMYADIVTASLHIPDQWGETGDVEPSVQLILECLPDFYGNEIALDEIEATGHAAAVMTQDGLPAVIQGDYPGRCRVLIRDTSGNDQLGLLWGFRSRHYDDAPTSVLKIEAEALTPVNGAHVLPADGASGGEVLAINNVPDQWTTMLTTTFLDGSPATHQGTYRVWARVLLFGPAFAVTNYRLLWGVGSLSVPVTNDFAAIPDWGGFWLVDLGLVHLTRPPVGKHEWVAALQVNINPRYTLPALIDCLYMQPVEEGGGQLVYTPIPSPASITQGFNFASTVDTVVQFPVDALPAGQSASAWADPWNAAAWDAQPASVFLSVEAGSESGPGGVFSFSQYLLASGFGFTIPASATIVGIEAGILRTSVQWPPGNGGYIVDNVVSLVKAGAVQFSTNKAVPAPWPTNEYAFQGYGSSTDLWSDPSWTPADINDPGFGLALMVFNGNVNEAAQALVDTMILRISYSLGTGLVISQDAVVYANRMLELRTDGMYRDANPSSTGVYGPVRKVIGDLPRIPPSGLEGRPLELFVKNTEGDFDPNGINDFGLDSFTAQVKYRPGYLGRQ